MGQKRDLTDAEKAKIVKSVSEGCSTLEISKILGRDHRTIKRFVANIQQDSQQGRKKRVEKKRRILTTEHLRRIKHEATRNPLSTSAAIFNNCNLPGVSRSTRCSVLRDVTKSLLLAGTIRRYFSAQTSGEVQIRNVLKERFPLASSIKVVDISGGCGAMYEVHIESVEFKGRRLVQQHQMINQALKDEIQSMDGLRIFTAVPK